jgi:PAS domain S-box-containing protein
VLRGDRLAELLALVAEAPDLATAGEYLLAELTETTGAARAWLFTIEGDRLAPVAANIGGDGNTPGSLPLYDTGHPLVIAALSLCPISSDGQCVPFDETPLGAWLALPFGQPQMKGALPLLRDYANRELSAGCHLHVPGDAGARRLGRAPSGLVVLELAAPMDIVEPLDRIVMMAGAVISRVAAAEGSRRSSERFEAQSDLLDSIIDALPDPIVITDAANDIVVQNRQAEHLLLARDADSPGRRRAVEINNLLFTSFLAKSVMAGGLTGGARELNLVDPDEGTDLLFEVLGHPLESSARDGQYLAVLRDVTDLRRAVNELERQIQRVRLAEIDATRERDRLNLILENVADPILVTDDRSNIILLNEQAERLFAAPDSASLDSTREHAVRDNDTKFTTFISDFTIDPATSTRAQMRLVGPRNGVEVPMEVVSGKILNERGESIAIVSVLHDLTKQEENERLYDALKRLNSELEQRIAEATADLAEQNQRLQWQSQEVAKANKLKSDFLATMSHELRTPINALIGYSALLLDRIYGELTPQQEEGLKRIRASANHLLELINDILDLAKIEAGKMPINLETVSVADVITEVSKQIEPMFKSKSLAYEVELPPDLPPLVTDRTKVKQILLNLLSNAVKFTPKGTVKVAIRVDEEMKGVRIAVSDTGIGIQPRDLETIWEDFRQLDQSRTREYGGTGLGLSITKKLATQLGGRVWVESSFGAGSTFTVHLPISSVREAEVESRMANGSSSKYEGAGIGD